MWSMRAVARPRCSLRSQQLWRSCALRTFHVASQNLVDGHFPDFKPRDSFVFENHPHWFVGHMSKGKIKIQRKLKDVDVLLEVRDARAPFTSAQFELTQEFAGRKAQRLVILNKADLVTPNLGLAMRDVIEQAGQPCLLTAANENKNLIKIKNFAMDHAKAKYPRTLGLMLMVVGLPNVGKSTIINGLKSIAFSAARRQGKDCKLMHGVKWTQAKVNGVPGITRDVTFFQLSNMPRLYCYDTPGISLLKKRNDPERNTKLGLLKTMPDHFAGEVYLADYLLYRLNRERCFHYVREFELPGPTDDVRLLTSHISAVLAHRKSLQVYWSDLCQGATFFLDLWRQGKLGKLSLDHIPNPQEVQRLRSLRVETEPPGPWGPPCYPEVPLGLELDSNGPLLP
eukprot:CAMPEP_0175636094 /NCGR_PEP_ID=MMETSP0097-20121207/2026_1 /TAXON_ID=311494 /ORGANISM="Alexandrium monilatum, Strain CCMP3105" /LENGTH=396 /DNA_ID=CAMNT_0016941745 /DNA_START=98 /DNA_END=1285 /DNA_ORIENTATION=-